jgi:hypothetical protein
VFGQTLQCHMVGKRRHLWHSHKRHGQTNVIFTFL